MDILKFWPQMNCCQVTHFERTWGQNRAYLGAQQERIHLQCRGHKRNRFHPCVGQIPWRRKWQPTPAFLPGEEPGWLQSIGLQSQTQLKWLSMDTGGQNKFGANDFHLSELLGNLYSLWKLPRENSLPHNWSLIIFSFLLPSFLNH